MGIPSALKLLLKFQLSARFRRAVTRFRQPRRLALSILAVVLAGLWLGQAVLGILFRSPADPQRLMQWISLGFMGYACWHVIKSVVRTPIEPFDWTPTEHEMLGGAPLTRRQRVRYRLAGIVLPAVVKSGCFAVVMIPDLHVLLAGWLGMFLALVSLDLLRMLTEIVTFGVRHRTFLWMRFAALSLAGGLALRTIVPVMVRPEVMAYPDSLVVLKGMIDELMALSTSSAGLFIASPFRLFTSLILAPEIGAGSLATLTAAFGLVGTLAASVTWIDDRMWNRRVAREKEDFQYAQAAGNPSATVAGAEQVRRAWRQPTNLYGAASIAWRQAWGARTYEVSILVALLVPGVLSLLPLLGNTGTAVATLQMIGSLIFYTLVLLPAAFKFDFRRDIDRIVVLKALPIHPWAVAIGQLAVPVALCTLFQTAVMLIAMAIRPFGVATFVIAFFTMALTNCLIFALENLIFLLYPYRLNQEGVDIFLRSIIVLTAKTALFGFGLAVTLGWTYAGAGLSSISGLGTRQVFSLGMSATLCVSCGILLGLLVRVYRGFDPSQDVPAMS